MTETSSSQKQREAYFRKAWKPVEEYYQKLLRSGYKPKTKDEEGTEKETTCQK